MITWLVFLDWNFLEKERHPEAKARKSTAPEHDIYAAINIVTSTLSFDLEEDLKQALERLVCGCVGGPGGLEGEVGEMRLGMGSRHRLCLTYGTVLSPDPPPAPSGCWSRRAQRSHC